VKVRDLKRLRKRDGEWKRRGNWDGMRVEKSYAREKRLSVVKTKVNLSSRGSEWLGNAFVQDGGADRIGGVGRRKEEVVASSDSGETTEASPFRIKREKKNRRTSQNRRDR